MTPEINSYTPSFEELISFLKLTDFSGDISIDEYAHKVIGNASFLAIIIDNHIMGLSIFYENRQQKDFAYLTYIALRQEIRGKGYGDKLMNRTIETVFDHGFKAFRLEVKLNNMVALRMYKSFGFKPMETDGNSSSIHMELLSDNF